MKSNIHACIAYIVCLLISGKRITTLFDLSGSREIDIRNLAEARGLRDFDNEHRDYIPGYANGCKYDYTLSSGHSIGIFINEKTFVVHIRGSSVYFIGNIQGDTIHIYDHKESAHFKYRISGFIEDEKKVEHSLQDDSGITGGN